MERIQDPGFDVVVVQRGALNEFHVTLHPGSADELSLLLQRVSDFLRDHKAEVVKHDVFGDSRFASRTREEIAGVFDRPVWPVTWVEGGSCDGQYLAGMQIMAISGVEVNDVDLEDRVVGRAFSDDWNRYCFLGDIQPRHMADTRGHQVKEVFKNLEQALGRNQMNFSNLARTWLFLDDILSWYDEFNEVRTALFQDRGTFDGLLPASTGVGAGNPARTALCTSALAVHALKSSGAICEVSSPLQNAAGDYGSSFSRAVEIETPDLKRLLISGTAAIDADGVTLHCGDAPAQIDHTMRVVEAILKSRGMDWGNVSRATAYFKHRHDAPAFSTWLHDQQAGLPVVSTHCDVCRDDLLFEIEVDAVSLRTRANQEQ